MKKYNGTKKRVKINGKRVTAFFPRGHSTVRGIFHEYREYDRNAGDAWANCRDWVREMTLYVLWKEKDGWEKVNDISAGPLNDVLFDLECPIFKKKYLLMEEEEQTVSGIKESEKYLNEIRFDLKEIEKSIKKGYYVR